MLYLSICYNKKYFTLGWEEINPIYSIYELKTRISLVFGLRPEEQILNFSGKISPDEMSLLESNIK